MYASTTKAREGCKRDGTRYVLEIPPHNRFPNSLLSLIDYIRQYARLVLTFIFWACNACECGFSCPVSGLPDISDFVVKKIQRTQDNVLFDGFSEGGRLEVSDPVPSERQRLEL